MCAKRKPKLSKKETPKKLDLESHRRILVFLAGLMGVVGDKLTLDETLALHRLMGTKLYDSDGRPYHTDDGYALETLREMSARGIANFRKKGHKKCARTTNSTKRKVAKRKSA